MKIGRAALAQLDVLIANAGPLKGNFFRPVAFRYFHPDDVISGDGTRIHGGRFAPAGVPAVYASRDEETAMREVTARKDVLGGHSQIEIEDYPRMTCVLAVSTSWNLDLTQAVTVSLGRVIQQCATARSRNDSQQIASVWLDAGIESVIFPSATGTGKNVVIYPGNLPSGSVAVLNRDKVLSAIRQSPGGVRRHGPERIRKP